MYNGHILTDTLLHMDMTDAINILIYSEGQVEESGYMSDDHLDGYAVWLLWARQYVEPLREYLREYYRLGPDIDPIHSGDLRIYPEMMPDFGKRRILPYTIHQRVGQAVIIPAMTPHYVRLNVIGPLQSSFYYFLGPEQDECYENSM